MRRYGRFSPSRIPLGAKQAAEKLGMNDERAKFEGCKTINQPSQIAPRASWCDPFFAPFEKLSFSAACEARTLQSVAFDEFFPSCEVRAPTHHCGSAGLAS
jgi:hypothetical protein